MFVYSVNQLPNQIKRLAQILTREDRTQKKRFHSSLCNLNLLYNWNLGLTGVLRDFANDFVPRNVVQICFLRQVVGLTICCLLLSILLCTPLMMVTKLEIRQNMVTNKSTSYCYEVKIETIKQFNVKLIFYLMDLLDL